jgi:hypothetical protein
MTAASRGPERAMFICCGEPPDMFDRGTGTLALVIERGGRGSHVVKYRLPALIIGWRSDGIDCS